MVGKRSNIKLVLKDIFVSFVHQGSEMSILNNLSFSVGDNEFVCLLGPSGCGKSTILNVVSGFVRPDSGEVRIDGNLITKPGLDRGYVFQRHSLFPWKTVGGNIEFGPRMRRLPKKERQKLVSYYAKEVDLSDFIKSYPYQLSGGMQQRVGLARAFANDPEILLMDEPFASLDAQTSFRMQQLLNKIWAGNPKTVLFVTHNINEALLLADKILLLSARPATLKKEISVNISRPRSHDILDDPKCIDLRHEMTEFIFGIKTP